MDTMAAHPQRLVRLLNIQHIFYTNRPLPSVSSYFDAIRGRSPSHRFPVFWTRQTSLPISIDYPFSKTRPLTRVSLHATPSLETRVGGLVLSDVCLLVVSLSHIHIHNTAAAAAAIHDDDDSTSTSSTSLPRQRRRRRLSSCNQPPTSMTTTMAAAPAMITTAAAPAHQPAMSTTTTAQQQPRPQRRQRRLQ